MTDLMKSLGNKPRKGKVRKCPVCGKEFYRKPSDGMAKYCSWDCKRSARPQTVRKTCPSCGKEFSAFKSSEKHRGSVYCSQKCVGAAASKKAAPGPKSKSGRKVHISALDNSFSRYIRSRDKWTCQRCGSVHSLGSVGLHTAHYIGRANKATRFDEENCIALCYGCHQFMDTHKGTSFREFMIGRLGQGGYDALVDRSNKLVKRTEADLAELRAKYRALEREQMQSGANEVAK